MVRRHTGRVNGQRYLGDLESRAVHDLDNEDMSPEGCRVNDVVRAGNEQPFDTLESAKCFGYEPCAKCVQAETRWSGWRY